MVIGWLKKKLRARQKSSSGSLVLKSNSGLDSDAVEIVDRLSRAGFETYLVGGCVRDFLLGSKPKDFDIATSASPQQIKALIKRSTIIGRRFKIVLARRFNQNKVPSFDYCPANFVPQKDKEFQITTFRRKPELVGDVLNENVFGNAKDDALRRDFTINALFMNPRTGQIIDYLGGQQDLKNKVIRVIGNAEERYAEDPVRLLRALRFQVRTGFQLAPPDLSAFKTCTHHLGLAKKERTREEILKSFREGYSAPFLNEVGKHGLWKEINQAYFDDTKEHQHIERTIELAKLADAHPWTHPLIMTPYFFVLLHYRVLSSSLQEEILAKIALDFRMSNAEKEGLLFLAQTFSKLKKAGTDPQRKAKFLQAIDRHSEKFFTFYYCFMLLSEAGAAPYKELFKNYQPQLKELSAKLGQRPPSRRGPAGGRRRRPRPPRRTSRGEPPTRPS